jgi:hypothetical protein
MILMPFAIGMTNTRENLSWMPCYAWLRESICHNFGETSGFNFFQKNMAYMAYVEYPEAVERT